MLDPVDGTKGLLHGRQYATVLALVEHGRVRVGAIACPRLRLDVNATRAATDAHAAAKHVALAAASA